MAGVDEWIVREYFELNGFFVRQLRRHSTAPRARRSEEELDLLVFNPQWKSGSAQPQRLLFGSELPLVSRAVVAVKVWQSSKFAPGTLRASGEVLKFLQNDVLRRAEDLFVASAAVGGEQSSPLYKILIVPGLPTHEPHRAEAINLLQAHGVDCLMSFRSILQDLVSKVEVRYNYQKSDLLQILRVFKNYDMLKSPQLELFGESK
jgi:hypothetical protein